MQTVEGGSALRNRLQPVDGTREVAADVVVIRPLVVPEDIAGIVTLKFGDIDKIRILSRKVEREREGNDHSENL